MFVSDCDTDVINRTAEAFSDHNPLADGDRNLHFVTGEWLDYETAFLALHYAVPVGYNQFEPKLLRRIDPRYRFVNPALLSPEKVEFVASLDFKVGREGSPVVYIRGDKSDLEDVKGLDLRADEIDWVDEDLELLADDDEPEGGEQILRLWWD